MRIVDRDDFLKETGLIEQDQLPQRERDHHHRVGHGVLPFTAHDLTDSDRAFWQRSKETAHALQGMFEAEDNADLMHLGETVAVLDLIEKGGHARYLYQARRT